MHRPKTGKPFWVFWVFWVLGEQKCYNSPFPNRGMGKL